MLTWLKIPIRTWRRVFAGCALLLAFALLYCARPVSHLVVTAWNDVDTRTPPGAGQVDDASRQNRTPVAEVWPVPADAGEAERQLAELLRRAAREQLVVSIAGVRHSMGGHTIYTGGIAVDMRPFRAMHLDAGSRLLHVQAGATWAEVIPYLDQRGFSVGVMQSNNSFTVGGSLSVNCHGWQFGKPPIASTVESLRLMKADGAIVRCSRAENAELFSLALGGYGLFGIILDAELRVVPNARYELHQEVAAAEELLTTFDGIVAAHQDVAMLYGRMNVTPKALLKQVVVNAYYPASAADDALPTLHDPGMVTLRRNLFRGSAGSEYGKELRWEAETRWQPYAMERITSRNQLLNESTATFENRSGASTDILHEYFLPRAGVQAFLQAVRKEISRHDVDLLNVTVRQVETDHDAFLRYADQPMIAFVMLFQQSLDPHAEGQMQSLTERLIDAAIASGGRYYLPYRLHATPEQFHLAYPQADEFFRLKRKYDPSERFQSQFYAKYGRLAR